MKKHLNLGCGIDYRSSTDDVEWFNIDYNPKNKADLHLDLELVKLPFEDNSIDYIYANQIFEHIHNFVDLMIEIHRVLAKDGTMFISVPLFPCEAAITDPEHCRFFTRSSFYMFCDPTVHSYFRGAGRFRVNDLMVKVPVIKGYTEAECSTFSKVLEVTLQKTNWVLENNKWVIK